MWSFCQDDFIGGRWHGWGGMFLYLLLIGGGIYLLVRMISSGGSKVNNSALPILEEEFAKGKISKEDFVERKRILKEE
ncbi:hypothetical protein [Halonatronum saccharophilum]|uniref:hypothetical protein n=1 Tax=Halonatronum saccharophilum TaxID=150060 RepID=UPI0004B11132|nr:hypothetical protein [Halonatronum saccharophilum]